jgi:RNase P subunit RPR2
MDTPNGDRGQPHTEVVRIVSQEHACSNCGRSLLTGEQAQVVADSEATLVICELCRVAGRIPAVTGVTGSG